jgi:hypothetical protein
MTAEFPKHPFLLTAEETAQALGTDLDKGLTSDQVAELQTKYPKNELDVGGSVPAYKIFTKQLLNAMIIVSDKSSSSHYPPPLFRDVLKPIRRGWVATHFCVRAWGFRLQISSALVS